MFIYGAKTSGDSFDSFADSCLVYLPCKCSSFGSECHNAVRVVPPVDSLLSTVNMPEITGFDYYQCGKFKSGHRIRSSEIQRIAYGLASLVAMLCVILLQLSQLGEQDLPVRRSLVSVPCATMVSVCQTMLEPLIEQRKSSFHLHRDSS